MYKKAFTLVELMIVIAIIGILAATLFPSMNAYLARSRDSARIQTAHKLSQFIKFYAIDFGGFPPVTSPNNGSWDSDIDGDLLEELKKGGFQLTSPGQSSKIWGSPSGQANFEYYSYTSGWGDGWWGNGGMGCDKSRGDFYVLGIPNLESWIPQSGQLGRFGTNIGSKELLSKSPGFWCGSGAISRDWGTDYEWVTGGYISGMN